MNQAQPAAADALAGARVLVTGGTRGIGAAIVEQFQAVGAQVIAAARHPVPGAPCPVVVADVSDPDAVARLVDEVTDQLGGVDVLINNAGAQTWTSDGILAIDDATWRAQIDTNLVSSIRIDRALLPGMIDQGSGVIIHVTSVQARLPIAGSLLPYAVAKAGLTLYSKGLANEVGQHGIRVNALAPALIATEGTTNLEDTRTEQGQRLGVPFGHSGRPADVAHTAVFLASPAAAFITGTEITIDGGVTPTTH